VDNVPVCTEVLPPFYPPVSGHTTRAPDLPKRVNWLIDGAHYIKINGAAAPFEEFIQESTASRSIFSSRPVYG
jgi:hypothetical protein